tara:strand:- start:242 stop:568 length:327 start_codon:yes stop_codon:yes gene_type:complete
MSDYNWCHGPECHKRRTTTRVRGVKGSKVLRTIKIPISGYRSNSVWKYFCDQTCMHDFIRTHIQEFVQLHPRAEALETPIEDPKKVRPYENAYWHNWEIKEVDENRQT